MRRHLARLSPILLGLLLTIATGCFGHVRAGGRTVAREVPVRVGAVAFSPGGDALAVVQGDALLLLSLDGEELLHLPTVGALRVDWSEAQGLILTHEGSPGVRLSRVGLEDGALTPIVAGEAPDGARAWGPDLALVDARLQALGIGVLGSIELAILEKGRSIRLSADLTFPTLDADHDFLSSWLHAGPRPGVGSWAVAVYRDPPAVPPSFLIVEVDPVAGAPRELAVQSGRRLSLPLSWSSDGRRLAFTDDAGALRFVDAKSGEVSPGPESPARGFVPTFGPNGNYLHLGGWLLALDGRPARRLLREAPEAIGIFASGGERLVVLDAHGLHLFELEPPPSGGAGADTALAGKLTLLRHLLRQGLLEEADYLERRDKLLREAGLLP